MQNMGGIKTNILGDDPYDQALKYLHGTWMEWKCTHYMEANIVSKSLMTPHYSICTPLGSNAPSQVNVLQNNLINAI